MPHFLELLRFLLDVSIVEGIPGLFSLVGVKLTFEVVELLLIFLDVGQDLVADSTVVVVGDEVADGLLARLNAEEDVTDVAVSNCVLPELLSHSVGREDEAREHSRLSLRKSLCTQHASQVARRHAAGSHEHPQLGDKESRERVADDEVLRVERSLWHVLSKELLRQVQGRITPLAVHAHHPHKEEDVQQVQHMVDVFVHHANHTCQRGTPRCRSTGESGCGSTGCRSTHRDSRIPRRRRMLWCSDRRWLQ